MTTATHTAGRLPTGLVSGACLTCTSSSRAVEPSARCRRPTCERLPLTTDTIPAGISPKPKPFSTRRRGGILLMRQVFSDLVCNGARSLSSTRCRR
ncbi:Secreted protein [Plasmodiophora brassicae]|uniref:Uncharacterized protein n=1 Tax=Plasmodiophora brassicae TaxID=37360 RepID=A0A0G4J2W7_PLABS|nr:hypothetical protein PBRA_008626 [Plasmodiophora brassicae]